MDLGAWLRPGGSWVVNLVDGQEAGRPDAKSHRGQLVEHRGRPVWFCTKPQPSGRRLLLTVELTGHSLDPYGTVTPAESTSSVALLELLGQVRGCRHLAPELYLLRLNLLGRVINYCD